tara:strand:+ start:59 stop:298 length:240 start_codon:yes stop_codon:yes gene_type:complete
MKLLLENWRKYLNENTQEDWTLNHAYRAFILNANLQGNISPKALLSPDNKDLKKHIHDYNPKKDKISDEELYNFIMEVS